MKETLLNRSVMLGLVVAAAMFANGCGQQAEQPVAQTADDDHEGHAHDDSNHDGWWCVEHGIPEESCSMCSTKAAADFKDKGDWCAEHNRAESQCFVCHPEKAEKFAKLYEAKYGRAPPKPEAE